MELSEVEGKAADVHTQPRERPWIFGLLTAPLAVLSNGLIGGALFFLLLKEGVGAARASEIVAFLNTPQIIYFLWSPITDFWMRRRTWLMVASTAAAAFMVAAFRQPGLASSWAVGLMFLSACLGQLVVAACGGMMGALRTELNRRRASSFYQGGSLAFGALAVSVLVLLSTRIPLNALGWFMAAMIALPSLAALAAPEQRVVGGHTVAETFTRIWHEFIGTFLRWEAIPYTLLMLFPMGSGAMIQELPGLAVDYHISSQQVAWINGLAGALLMASGALSATLATTRVRASVMYLTVCLVNEGTLALMALGPPRPVVYFAGTVMFLFTVGACYALFTAVVLEFLGSSGKSGSARYSIINSMGNVPIVYMVLIDGYCYARWGTRAMPGADALVGGLGGSILLMYFLSRGRKTTVEQLGAL